MTDPGAAPRPAAVLAIPLGMLLAASAVVPFVGRASLSNDEGWSLAFARLPWPTLWTAVHHLDAVFLFYYALLHVWLAAGDSVTVLRIPSTVAILAALPPAFASARRLFGPVVAAVATLLLAVNPFLVGYAKEARPYALVFLFEVCATLLLLRLLESPSRANALAYAALATLAVYAHAFAVLVVVAQAVSAFVLPRAPRAAGLLAASVGAIALACVPLALLVHAAGTSQIAWITRPSPGDWLTVLKELAGGRIAFFVAAVACVALLPYAREPRQGSALAAVACWLVVPLALVALYSYAVAPVLLSRYLIFSVFPLVLLTAAGVGTLRRPAPIAVATLALVLVCGRIDWSQRNDDGENYRAAAAFIAAQAAPGDLVAVPEARFAFDAAVAERARSGVPPVVYPTAAWKFWLGPQPLSALDPVLLDRAGTVWVIERGYHAHAPPVPGVRGFETVLAPRFEPAGETDFGYVGVVRYVRR